MGIDLDYSTFAPYLEANWWESVVFPERGGPVTTNLQGGRGWGGRRYGRGFLRNFPIASPLDRTYILSKKLKREWHIKSGMFHIYAKRWIASLGDKEKIACERKLLMGSASFLVTTPKSFSRCELVILLFSYRFRLLIDPSDLSYCMYAMVIVINLHLLRNLYTLLDISSYE